MDARRPTASLYEIMDGLHELLAGPLRTALTDEVLRRDPIDAWPRSIHPQISLVRVCPDAAGGPTDATHRPVAMWSARPDRHPLVVCSCGKRRELFALRRWRVGDEWWWPVAITPDGPRRVLCKYATDERDQRHAPTRVHYGGPHPGGDCICGSLGTLYQEYNKYLPLTREAAQAARIARRLWRARERARAIRQ